MTIENGSEEKKIAISTISTPEYRADAYSTPNRTPIPVQIER